LTSATTGGFNTAIGGDALAVNTTAAGSTAVGFAALDANTTADFSTAVGFNALTSNTTGASNTAVGGYSLDASTTAADNTGTGYDAGTAVTTGSNSCFYGKSAGPSVTTGGQNQAFGKLAGSTTTTGENNTSIGYYCRPNASGDSNCVVVGSNGMIGKGGTTAFISGGNGPVYAGNNSANFATTSDRRIKKNIEDNNTGLDAISQVRVRNFEYRTADEIDELPVSAAIDKQGVQLGVIAQEIQEILPDVVRQETTGCLSVDPENITWYLINAVKELKTELDAAKSRIETLENA